MPTATTAEPAKAKKFERENYGTINLSDEQFTRLLETSGNVCVGLGRAIDGLARGHDLVNAAELSKQLLFIAKTVSWSLKLAAEARSNGS